jgi:hypothetical protein
LLIGADCNYFDLRVVCLKDPENLIRERLAYRWDVLEVKNHRLETIESAHQSLGL